jgi:hypothetical protein
MCGEESTGRKERRWRNLNLARSAEAKMWNYAKESSIAAQCIATTALPMSYLMRYQTSLAQIGKQQLLLDGTEEQKGAKNE